MRESVLSVFDVAPRRVGGVEMLAAAVSRSLVSAGWRSVLAFPKKPTPLVEQFLAASGAEILATPEIFAGGIAGARALSSLVGKTKAGTVHLSFTPLVGPLPWACRVGGAKAVYFTDQGSRSQDDKPRPAGALKKFVARCLTAPYKKVFCVSGFVKQDLQTRGYLADEQLTILYNCIDFERLAGAAKGAEFRRKFGIGADKVLVSQVCWLTPEKGVEDFIRAAAIAKAQEPNVHFCLAGDGPRSADYMQLAKDIGLEQALTFTGLIENPVADGLYAASDFVCLLSRWQEACAFVISESMAHGKPMVVTRVGGNPELIDDGVTGFVVPPQSPAEAAQRILQLCRDQSLRSSLGRASFDKASRQFNLKDNVARLVACYGVGN